MCTWHRNEFVELGYIDCMRRSRSKRVCSSGFSKMAVPEKPEVLTRQSQGPGCLVNQNNFWISTAALSCPAGPNSNPWHSLGGGALRLRSRSVKRMRPNLVRKHESKSQRISFWQNSSSPRGRSVCNWESASPSATASSFLEAEVNLQTWQGWCMRRKCVQNVNQFDKKVGLPKSARDQDPGSMNSWATSSPQRIWLFSVVCLTHMTSRNAAAFVCFGSHQWDEHPGSAFGSCPGTLGHKLH